MVLENITNWNSLMTCSKEVTVSWSYGCSIGFFVQRDNEIQAYW